MIIAENGFNDDDGDLVFQLFIENVCDYDSASVSFVYIFQWETEQKVHLNYRFQFIIINMIY